MSKPLYVIAAVLLAVSGMARAGSAVDLAELVAPTDLVATHICVAVAEQDFAPRFMNSVRAKRPAVSVTADELRRLLEGFDRVANGFCEATRIALRGKKAELAAMFARHYAVPLDPAWDAFIKDPVASVWARDDAAFSVQTGLLIALFPLVNGLRPESFGKPLRGAEVLRFAAIEDEGLRRQYESITKGTGDLAYRRMISLMLNDGPFRTVVPGHYQVGRLAALDAELLRRGERVTRPGLHPGFGSLESTFVRTESQVQDLLRPDLQTPYREALKALAEAAN